MALCSKRIQTETTKLSQFVFFSLERRQKPNILHLSENQVLTAGHCFRFMTIDRFELCLVSGQDETPDSGVPIEYEDPKDWIVVSGTLCIQIYKKECFDPDFHYVLSDAGYFVPNIYFYCEL